MLIKEESESYEQDYWYRPWHHELLCCRHGGRRAASSSPTPRARAPRRPWWRFSKTGERMVGQVAKRQAITNPDRTIASIKRQMGTDYKVNIDGKKYTPQEISAMILQKLKADAESYLGETVTAGGHHRAGVLHRRTAPGDQGRRHHRGPGGQAYHQRADGRGSGLRRRQGETTRRSWSTTLAAVRSTSPSSRWATACTKCLPPPATTALGGDDFDKRIIDWMADEFKKENGIDLRKRQDGHAAPEGSRRKGEDRAVRHDDHATSTCRSSRRTPPARSILI